MKPLTIEELKALEVGDWVWIITSESKVGTYEHIRENEGMMLVVGILNRKIRSGYFYSDYGTKWLAYKNKEQAEAKGEIVELPCIRKVTHCIHGVGNQETVWRVYLVRDEKLGHYINGIDFIECRTEKEAEARLQELRGEK